VAYLIPSNRSPQADGVSNLQRSLVLYQNWYREQMQRNGFGPKTFRFETQGDGKTPLVHIAQLPAGDAHYRADDVGNDRLTMYNRIIADAPGAGIPVFSNGQVWLLITEQHLQQLNGAVIGDVSLGASFGSGDDGGVGVLSSLSLAMADPDALDDDVAYGGRYVPDLGPYPLAEGISFESYEGTTLSSVASARSGAILHELSHGFGLGHDFRNDENFVGNLMGNGLRGLRGSIYPTKFPGDQARLAYASALALNVSRYFNPPRDYADDERPQVWGLIDGPAVLSRGKVKVNFSAADDSGLSLAILRLDDNVVGEMRLSGTEVATGFTTAHFVPGQANHYQVNVYDSQGNRRDVDVSLSVDGGAYNRAPVADVKIPLGAATAGKSVQLDASTSTDPDDSFGDLTVEWDLDGNGTFDTAPTTTKSRSATFATPGFYAVRARLTDPDGAWSISQPIGFRVNMPNGRPDVAAPRAGVYAAPRLTRGGGRTYLFKVRFRDVDGLVDVSDIDSRDVRVGGPRSFAQSAKLVKVNATRDGAERIATYQITAPGDFWDRRDNGQYTLTLRGGQVGDTSDNFTALKILGTFNVRVGDLPRAAVSGTTRITTPAKTTTTAVAAGGPSAVPTPAAAAAQPGIKFTVTYRDDKAMNPRTFDDRDIVVTGPWGFAVPATFVSAKAVGRSMQAVYRVEHPRGYWEPGDNGWYRVRVQAEQIADVQGNYVPPVAIGSFQVRLTRRLG